MSYDLEYGEFRNKPLAFLRQTEHPDLSDALYLVKKWPKMFAYPNYFEDSEYSSSGFIGRANTRTWEAAYADLQGKNWWDLGSEGILVRLDLLTKEQREDLRRLEDYPVLDDEELQKIEDEEIARQWDDWGRRDLVRDLEKKAESIHEDDTGQLGQIVILLETLAPMYTAITDLPEGELESRNKVFDEAIWQFYQGMGEYPIVEGRDVSFPYGDFVKSWDGTLLELGRLFDLDNLDLDDHPWFGEMILKIDPRVTVELSQLAWDQRGNTKTLKIKPKDLPASMRSLISKGGTISTTYDPEICEHPYLECFWEFLMDVANSRGRSGGELEASERNRRFRVRGSS